MRVPVNASSASARLASSSLGSSTIAMAQAEQMIEALVRQSRRLEQAMGSMAIKTEPTQTRRGEPAAAVEPDVPPSIEEFMALNKTTTKPVPAFPADYEDLYSDDEDDEEDEWEEYLDSLEEDQDCPGIELDMKPFQFASGSHEEEEAAVKKAENSTGAKPSAVELQKKTAALVQKLNAAILDFDTEDEDDAYLIESDEEGELSSFCIEDDDV